MPRPVPIAPVPAGVCLGISQVGVSGVQTSLSIQPSWGAPSAVGNIRAIVVESDDTVAPLVQVVDPDKIAFSASATGVTHAFTPRQLGAAAANTAPAQTLVGTVVVARSNVNVQPPVVVNFPGGATNPRASLYEWAHL